MANMDKENGELGQLFTDEEGEPLSVEKSFTEIEARIEALENGDAPLEDAFRLFKEGMELIRYAHTAIDSVEQQVLKLSEEGEAEEM